MVNRISVLLLVLIVASVVIGKVRRRPMPAPVATPASVAAAPSPEPVAPAGATPSPVVIQTGTPASSPTPATPAAPSFLRLTLDEVPGHLRRMTSGPSITMFYATTCSNSRHMMPQVARLARTYGRADFRAISTDDEEDAPGIPAFLRAADAPFQPLWLAPWPSGQFTSMMNDVGVRIGSTFTLPLIILRDGQGNLVSFTEGVVEIDELERYLKRAS